jgi:hypothetical protein
MHHLPKTISKEQFNQLLDVLLVLVLANKVNPIASLLSQLFLRDSAKPLYKLGNIQPNWSIFLM